MKSVQVYGRKPFKGAEKVEKFSGTAIYAGGSKKKGTKELNLRETKNGKVMGDVSLGLIPSFGVKDENGKTVYPRSYSVSPKMSADEASALRAKKASAVDKNGNAVFNIEVDPLFVRAGFFAENEKDAHSIVKTFSEIVDMCKPKFEGKSITAFPLNVEFAVNVSENNGYKNMDVVSMKVKYNENDPEQAARVEKILELAKKLPHEFDDKSLGAFLDENKARWFTPSEYKVPTKDGEVQVVENKYEAPAVSHDEPSGTGEWDFNEMSADDAPALGDDTDIPF